jgi:hypothetical protein
VVAQNVAVITQSTKSRGEFEAKGAKTHIAKGSGYNEPRKVGELGRNKNATFKMLPKSTRAFSARSKKNRVEKEEEKTFKRS